MKKLAILCVAVLGAALLVLGTTSSASAYPDLTCNTNVDRQVVHPGQSITATGAITGADANRPVTWAFRWNGVTKHRTGATAHASFTAPDVTHTKVLRLAVEGSASLNGVPRTCVQHYDITVIAAQVSAPSDSGLPNTGGPAFWILVAALVLLLAGGGAVIASRRRRS